MSPFSLQVITRVWKIGDFPPQDLSQFYGVDLHPFTPHPLSSDDPHNKGAAAILHIADVDWNEHPLSVDDSRGLLEEDAFYFYLEEMTYYEDQVQQSFHALAGWLARLSPDVIRRHYSDGWQFDAALYYSFHKGEPELRMDLPTELMTQLGRVDIPLRIRMYPSAE